MEAISEISQGEFIQYSMVFLGEVLNNFQGNFKTPEEIGWPVGGDHIYSCFRVQNREKVKVLLEDFIKPAAKSFAGLLPFNVHTCTPPGGGPNIRLVNLRRSGFNLRCEARLLSDGRYEFLFHTYATRA